MSNGDQLTQQALAAIRRSFAAPDKRMLDSLGKAWVQSASATSGITAYDLEPAAKILYPVITPLRNFIPRTSGRGGIQANWRAITGVNTNNAGVAISQGNRGVIQATTTQDYTAAYKALGLDDTVTFEADLAAEGFDDVKSLAVMGLLRALMIGEELMLLGGNSSIALGTTPQPSLSTATTGGSIAASVTVSVICVAMTLEGYKASSVANGVVLSGTRTLADGTTEFYNAGTAQKSTNQTQTVGSGTNTNTVTASVTPVTGAAAYAWFWGTAGSETLGAITSTSSITITVAAGTGSQAATAGFAADYSQNSLTFDGLLTIALKSGSNAYVNTMTAGNTLTADGTGGVVEIDTALKSFWDNFRLSPDAIWVNSQEQLNISKKVLGGTSTAAQRFVFDADQGKIAGGNMVRSYLNKYSMDGAQEIPIKLHPNMPAGTILFTTEKLPYPLSNVQNVMQVRCRRDYYQIDWPITNRKYQYGVYTDQVLQHYFPPSLGVINNIANG